MVVAERIIKSRKRGCEKNIMQIRVIYLRDFISLLKQHEYTVYISSNNVNVRLSIVYTLPKYSYNGSRIQRFFTALLLLKWSLNFRFKFNVTRSECVSKYTVMAIIYGF